MNLTLDEIKDIITFAREAGVKRLKVGRLDFVFDSNTPDIIFSDGDDLTDEQRQQAYQRTLLASSR